MSRLAQLLDHGLAKVLPRLDAGACCAPDYFYACQLGPCGPGYCTYSYCYNTCVCWDYICIPQNCSCCVSE